jgi:hypothetical protein
MYNLIEKYMPAGMSGIVGFAFSPILLILESIYFIKYWNIIKRELITKDKIFKFLDENGFGYINMRLVKKDIISPDHPLYTTSNDVNVTLEKLKNVIQKDFIQSLSKLIEENSKYDIMNYINVTVRTYIKMYRATEETYFFKLYTVYIQYWRYVIIVRYLKFTIILVLISLSFLAMYQLIF